MLSTLSTRQALQLTLLIASSEWEGSFDRLEVWRSRATADGPYDALHDDSWSPARLPVGFTGAASGSGPSVVLVGKSVSFLVNESVPITVTFTGSDPLNFGQAASQIIAQGQGLLSSFVSGGTLVVETVQAGVIATLRCTGGDAAPILGLPTQECDGSVAFGRDARILLVHGQTLYGFVDPNGSTAFFYKTRFYNAQRQLWGDFSDPFQGRRSSALPAENLVLCYVDLVDQNGNPAHNVEVLLHTRFGGVQANSRTVTSGSQRLLTDADGHAEALLVRGVEVGVALGGTPLARNVKVPTDPAIQSLNLLAPGSGSDDLFEVQVPNLPYAARRTL